MHFLNTLFPKFSQTIIVKIYKKFMLSNYNKNLNIFVIFTDVCYKAKIIVKITRKCLLFQ